MVIVDRLFLVIKYLFGDLDIRRQIYGFLLLWISYSWSSVFVRVFVINNCSDLVIDDTKLDFLQQSHDLSQSIFY